MRHSAAWLSGMVNRQPKSRDIEIKAQYIKHVRIGDIASRYGMTRQAVFKILRKLGIDTSCRQGLVRPCGACGEPVWCRRAKTRQQNVFCDSTCYHLWHKLNYTGIVSRYNGRRAREIVSCLTTIPTGAVVHHANGDPRDNRTCNLMLLASSRDHVRIHKGFKVKPVWIGAK
jgi:HNH endonuclease